MKNELEACSQVFSCYTLKHTVNPLPEVLHLSLELMDHLTAYSIYRNWIETGFGYAPSAIEGNSKRFRAEAGGRDDCRRGFSAEDGDTFSSWRFSVNFCSKIYCATCSHKYTQTNTKTQGIQKKTHI